MAEADNTPRPATLEQWAGAKPGKPVQLALLFTDIISSTKLCSEVGDRRWIDVLIKHFQKARSLLCRNNCYEVKIIGDSFMVAFENAVDALNFAVSFLNDTGHEDVRIRAGVHVGAARIVEDDIYGAMVNYAARVTKWHKKEGIALSDSAKEQVENELGTREARHMLIRVTHQFDDFDEPKVLWRVNLDELWRHRIEQEFPSLAELRHAGGPDSNAFEIEPATLDDLLWVAEIETKAYGPDAVPLDLMQLWYQKNRSGFFVIRSREGERVGHINLLPVRADAFQPLLEGKITEMELSPDALYAPTDKASIQDLYVESIIVCRPEAQSRMPVIYALLAEFNSLIANICDPSQVRQLYAIAATPAGERFMRQLGFEQIKAGSERLDRHPFFSARYEDIVVNITNIVAPRPVPGAAPT